MPGAQFQALLALSSARYRYFRWVVTDIVGTGGFNGIIYNAQISVDGGTTWLPTQTMTTNVLPTPLQASAISEAVGNEAFRAFDQSNTTFWATTAAQVADGTGHFAAPIWIQIDFGAGGGLIVPNKFRLAFFNSGADATWKNFSLTASQTGSFAGEEVLLKTVSGQTSQVDQANIVYNVP